MDECWTHCPGGDHKQRREVALQSMFKGENKKVNQEKGGGRPVRVCKSLIESVGNKEDSGRL